MTLFLLIRHAACDPVGTTIAGRAPGVHLNEAGADEARTLAARLARQPIDCVYSSPLERALETAAMAAAAHGIRVRTAPEFNEIDYGEWTGRTLASLKGDDLWRRWNEARGSTRVPDGETMLEVQRRAVAGLERLRGLHPGQTVAVVSHGDVIKALLAWCVAMPPDLMSYLVSRLRVDTASVSAVRVEEWGPEIIRTNDTGTPIHP